MRSRKKQTKNNDPIEPFDWTKGVTPIRDSNQIDYEPEPLPTRIKPRQAEVDPSEAPKGPVLPIHDIPRNVGTDEILSYQGDINFKVWNRLRKGELAPELIIDLHHFRVIEAAEYFSTIVYEAQQENIRCILIIHGKGSRLNPAPMIKNAVAYWVKSLPQIQGYCSAPGKLGGSGALLLYLRRIKNK